MRNQEHWKSSKFIYRKGKLIGSRNPMEVGISSRLVTDLTVEFYDHNLRLYVSGKLLDLGCGKVPLYGTYRELVTDNICVDWVNTLHKNQHLDYELDLTKQLPFGDNEFNTIILSDVLEHILVPEQLWSEMTRALSRKGKTIINVPFYYWLHEKPHDYYRYTEFALRRFVETYGLKLIQLEPMGGAMEVMADIFAKNILRLPKLGHSGALLAQWLASSFRKTKLGRKVSEATGRNFPIGYFLVAEKPY